MAIGHYLKKDSALELISRVLNDLEELPKEIEYLTKMTNDKSNDLEDLKEKLVNKNQECEKLRTKLLDSN